MLDKTGELVQTAQDGEEKGYNYRSERFTNRLKKGRRIHGDPATPVFRAYIGNRVIFRTMMPEIYGTFMQNVIRHQIVSVLKNKATDLKS